MTTGQELNQAPRPILGMWDADFLPFYICHTKDGDEPKDLDQCLHAVDSFLNNVNSALKADYFGGYLTVGKCFRYGANPSYKANRKYDNLPRYFKEIRDYLSLRYGFGFQEGYEADDLVLSFKAQNSLYETIIVSPDKDILNIEGSHYNPRLNEFKTTSAKEAHRFFWESMIKGDSADNIKGVPGKGEKFCHLMKVEQNTHGKKSYPAMVIDAYVKHFGEYEGVKEFYKNFISLKIVDDVKLEELKLNKIDRIFCE